MVSEGPCQPQLFYDSITRILGYCVKKKLILVTVIRGAVERTVRNERLSRVASNSKQSACLEARTDIPIAVNSGGDCHLHSDGKLRILCGLVVILKDRCMSST